MKSQPRQKVSYALHEQAFECLLNALDPDRQAASEEYERLRARLISFFRWQGSSLEEDLADESLDRLALKLYRGEQILNLRNYLHGIARMVMLEANQRRRREETVIEQATQLFRAATPESDQEARYAAMESCMTQMAAANRELLLDYYSRDSYREQSEKRQKLAASLGISLNALRNRALRLRLELERETLKFLESTGNSVR